MLACRAVLFDKLDTANTSNVPGRDEPSGIWAILGDCHVIPYKFIPHNVGLQQQSTPATLKPQSDGIKRH